MGLVFLFCTRCRIGPIGVLS